MICCSCEGNACVVVQVKRSEDSSVELLFSCPSV